VGGVRVKRAIIYDGNSHTRDIIKLYKYIKEDGSSSGWGFELPLYTETKTIRQYQVNSSWTTGQYAQEFASSFINSLVSDRLAGTLQGPMLTGANILKAAYSTVIVYIISIIYNILFVPDYKDYTATITKSDNVIASNPLPVQYSRVEVADEGNTNGKVIYEFTTDQLYPLRTPSLASPYSVGKQRFGHWLYGLPKIITWKNSANQNIRKVENIYNPIVREINNSNFISRGWAVNTDVSAGIDKTDVFSSSFLTSETYYPMQGRTELTKTIETLYNNSGGSAVTETSFTYSLNNFQIRTVSKKDSKGNYTGVTTYYSNDYTIPGVITTMKDSNMVNVPVSVNSWIKGSQPQDNEKLISAGVTEFAPIQNGDIRPYQVYQSELTAPLDNTVADPDNFNSGNLLTYSYLKPASALQYSQGNVSQTTALPGSSVASVIYDYQQSLPIAQVSNASGSDIRYTSFEADGTGGWIYNQNAVVTDYCPTGKKCFDLTKGNIEAGNPQFFAPIIVSLWTTGSQVFVTRTQAFNSVLQFTPGKTGPVINGWKYCEFELPYNEIGNISMVVSGNGLVDELRWYPKNARMSTCTYDPGIGKTSECDANNRIIYYEYDGLGRLIQVKDQFRNLVKAYEYNYKQ
jgi:hypothetical protein